MNNTSPNCAEDISHCRSLAMLSAIAEKDKETIELQNIITNLRAMRGEMKEGLDAKSSVSIQGLTKLVEQASLDECLELVTALGERLAEFSRESPDEQAEINLDEASSFMEDAAVDIKGSMRNNYQLRRRNYEIRRS